MKTKPEVVISGMSGSFPNSANVTEFQENLFAGINLVNKAPLQELNGTQVPMSVESIPEADSFDASYFGLAPRLANVTDPFCRAAWLKAIEAVCDAGVNPGEMSGSMTGTFGFSVYPLTEAIVSYCNNDSGLLGSSMAMLANRVAFTLDLKGPSFSLQGNMASLNDLIIYASDLIREGQINSAIINCVQLVSMPASCYHYHVMGRTSSDSITRSFSDDAAGYARSSGFVAFFLQREEDALRSYGRIVGASRNFMGSKQGPLTSVERGLFPADLRQLYSSVGVDPTKVAFIEGAGVASKVIDAEELNSLAEVMVSDERRKPLLVGCVKSNAGHAEGSADAVGLVKALIIANTGLIPPNINYSKPNSLVPALQDGRIKVVTETTPLEGDIIGVNSVCILGVFRHLIIERHQKGPVEVPTAPGVLPSDGLPRLFVMTGRDEERTLKCLEKVEQMPINPNFIGLSHRVFAKGIKNHNFRGYTVLNDAAIQRRDVQLFYSGSPPPPLWFVFTGMGSQWAGMGKALMTIPTFAKAIHNCHRILEPKGLDLIHIITTDDSSIFDNIVHSFVGIAAVQIGLVDILYEIGLKPDGMIGHSVGELGCGYADGCLTAEQMILAAYFRGRASVETELIEGMMAAVGMGYQKMKDMLPPEIEVACHNSSTSCTLSGPTEPMKKFVAELVAKGIFARLVNVSNIAYHSRYIKPAGPKLLHYMKQVLPEAKARSEKWISTSVPEDRWDSEPAKLCSAEYYTNNLLSSVLFEEGSVHVPEEAVILEISPHGLLQAILKRSFPKAHNIPLTNRSFQEGVVFLMDAFGKIYTKGINFDVEKLYPPVEYPVPRGTPNLSFVVNWKLNTIDSPTVQTLENAFQKLNKKEVKCARDMILNFEDDWKSAGGLYLKGSQVVPLSVYIKLSINETIFKYLERQENRGELEKPCTVEIKNLRLNRFVETKKGQLPIFAGVDIGFEASDSKGLIILHSIQVSSTPAILPGPQEISGTNRIPGESFYQHLKKIGLEYSQPMQLIKEFVDEQRVIKANILWNGDLTLFLEAVLLLPLIPYRHSKNLYFVKQILQFNINLKEFSSSEPKDVAVIYECDTNVIYSEGLKIMNPTVFPMSLKIENCSFMQQCFVPNDFSQVEDVNSFLEEVQKLIIGNIKVNYESPANLTIIEFKDIDIHKEIVRVFGSTPRFHVNVKVYLEDSHMPEVDYSSIENENYLVMSGRGQLTKSLNYLKYSSSGFLLLKNGNVPPGFEVIFSTKIGYDSYVFCNYVGEQPVVIPRITTSTNNWEVQLKNVLERKENKKVYLINSLQEGESDHILRKCKEFKNKNKIRYIFHDENELKLEKYNEHLKKDLRVNLFCREKWGRIGYRDKYVSFRPIELINVPITKFSEIRVNNVQINGLGLSNVEEHQFQAVDYSVLLNGKEVCGVGILDQATKTVSPDPILKWEKPKGWSDEEITSVLLYYTLAYYIYIFRKYNWDAQELADAQKTVLVIDGYLPLSQAIINIGYSEGYQVYTAYKSQEEKNLIKSIYPQFPEENMLNYETAQFDMPIKNHLIKKGLAGFNIIVNNSTDEKVRSALLSIISTKGLYFQSGFEKGCEGKIGMHLFLRLVTVLGAHPMVPLSLHDNLKERIQVELSNGLKVRDVKPLSHVAFSRDDSNLDALELMSDPKFFKKIVVSKGVPQMKNSQYYRADPRGTYILIVKENLGFWLGILDWLVGRSCRRINLIVDWNEHTSHSFKSINENSSDLISVVSPSTIDTNSKLKKYLSSIKSNGPIPLIFIAGDEETSRFKIICDEASDSHILYYSNIPHSCSESQGQNISQIVDIQKRMDSELMLSILDSIAQKPMGTLYLEPISQRFGSTVVVDDSQITFREYFPLSREEILSLCVNESSAYWKEVRTQSSRLAAHKTVNPIFFIPPLKDGSYDNLIDNLCFPALKAFIPKGLSLSEIVQQLYQSFLNFNPSGFLLVCSSWSSAIGISLARLVEESGKQVRLVLFDSDFNWHSDEPYLMAKNKVLSSLKDGATSKKQEDLIKSGFDTLKDRIQLARAEPLEIGKKLSGVIVLVSNSLANNHLLKRLQENTEPQVNIVTSSATSHLEMVNSKETIELINSLEISIFTDNANKTYKVTNLDQFVVDYLDCINSDI